MQPFVARPQRGAGHQANGREQMDVDISDPPSEQGVETDELQRLGVRCDAGAGQVRHRGKDNLALAQVFQGQFADDEGMRQNHP